MTGIETSKQAALVFAELADALETGRFGQKTRVILTTQGSELGHEELVRGAEMAVQQNQDLEVILIGPKADTDLQLIETTCEAEAHKIMEQLLESGEAQAAVTLHYNFPLGVATVGRVLTPAKGRSMLIATTTGTTAADRVQAMVLNALGGIAVAKSLGIAKPRLGILNVDGARQVERILTTMKEQGFELSFTESVRSDGGSVLRGNDLLAGTADVVVCDTLTGNLLMKMFSAFTSGGTYETQGWGYGPGVGSRFGKVINIISRASGAPVVAGALQYAAQCARGELPKQVEAEYQKAQKAGLEKLLTKTEKAEQPQEVKVPPKKPVTADITGIDIMELDDATKALWAKGIYAETGMGCAGPVIMLAPEDKDQAKAILKEKGYM